MGGKKFKGGGEMNWLSFFIGSGAMLFLIFLIVAISPDKGKEKHENWLESQRTLNSRLMVFWEQSIEQSIDRNKHLKEISEHLWR